MVIRRQARQAIRGPMGSLLVTAAVLAAAGCTDLFGGSGLVMTLAVSDTLVGPDRPITITVTARSTGDAVAWGRGSSSCQLSAVVRIEGVDRSIDIRACTDDLALQGVGARDSLTEAWSWRGEYMVDGVLDTLPAGRYRVFALAGTVERSRGMALRVAGE